MKLVMIMCNEAINDEVENLLEQNGINGFTKWTKVYGKGRTSGQHLGTHIWPKVNNVLVAAMEKEAANRVLQDIRELRTRFAKEGIKAFMWEVEDITP
jgi:nitrogen regulatory protein PII